MMTWAGSYSSQGICNFVPSDTEYFQVKAYDLKYYNTY